MAESSSDRTSNDRSSDGYVTSLRGSSRRTLSLSLRALPSLLLPNAFTHIFSLSSLLMNQIIPALALLSPSLDHSPPIILTPTQLVLWCASVAFFGVFLAVPLRKQVIVKEKLVFPSGSATAQLIGVLHGVKGGPSSGGAEGGNGGVRKRREAREIRGYQSVASSAGNEAREGGDETNVKIDEKGWRALMNSFTISAVYTVGFSFAQSCDIIETNHSI